MIKHFVKVLGYYKNRMFCKHEEVDSASCPFTQKTYVTCIRCGKRIAVVDTITE